MISREARLAMIITNNVNADTAAAYLVFHPERSHSANTKSTKACPVNNKDSGKMFLRK